ncbi:MAG: hypothetical protein WCP55_02045 [Lentisphaerota bacterium]
MSFHDETKFGHSDCHSLTAAILDIIPRAEAYVLRLKKHPAEISHSVTRLPDTETYIDAFGIMRGKEELDARKRRFDDLGEETEWKPMTVDGIKELAGGGNKIRLSLSMRSARPLAKKLIRRAEADNFDGLIESILDDYDEEENWGLKAGQPPDDYKGKAPPHNWNESDIQMNGPWSEKVVAKMMNIPPDKYIYRTMLDISYLDPKLAEHEEADRIRRMGEEEFVQNYGDMFDPETEDWMDVRNHIAEESGSSSHREEFAFKKRGFPPAVVTRIDKNKFQINDGNHRIDYWQEMGYDMCPAWVNDEWMRRGGL